MGEGELSLCYSGLFPHSTSSSSCFPSWLPISFPMVSGTGATDTYFPPLNASRGSSCPQRASRKYFSTVTLLQSAAITYRARGREEKQHFLRGKMKMRDIVSCKAHKNCVKVTGEGGSMSNKNVCVHGGKKEPRSSEGRKSPGPCFRSSLGQQTTSGPMPGALRACAFLLLKSSYETTAQQQKPHKKLKIISSKFGIEVTE